eukprot:gene30140-4839_t
MGHHSDSDDLRSELEKTQESIVADSDSLLHEPESVSFPNDFLSATKAIRRQATGKLYCSHAKASGNGKVWTPFSISELDSYGGHYDYGHHHSSSSEGEGSFPDFPAPEEAEAKLAFPDPDVVRPKANAAGKQTHLVDVTLQKKEKGGLGISLEKDKVTGHVIVVRVAPGSPAYVGKLAKADTIIAFIGAQGYQSVAGKSYEDVVKMLTVARDAGPSFILQVRRLGAAGTAPAMQKPCVTELAAGISA